VKTAMTVLRFAYVAAVILWLVTAPGCVGGQFSMSKAIGCATFRLAGGQCFEPDEPAEPPS